MAGRLAWIDAARGGALTAVVFLHAEQVISRTFDVHPALTVPNAMLDGFRMPTLIALSGILAVGLRAWAWEDVWRRRVAPLSLMYVAWMLLTGLAAMAWQGEPESIPAFVARGIVAPYSPLWYLYALVLYMVAAKLLARVPTGVLVAAAFVVFVVSRSVIEWGGTFYSWHWVLDHWIYFVCAERLARAYIRTAERATAARAVMALAAYLILAAIAVATGTATNPFVLIVLSVVGTLVALTCASQWGTAAWLGWARAIGRRSLGVYASHAAILALLWNLLGARIPSFSAGSLVTPVVAGLVTLGLAYALTMALHRWAPVPLLRPWWSTRARKEDAVTPAQ